MFVQGLKEGGPEMMKAALAKNFALSRNLNQWDDVSKMDDLKKAAMTTGANIVGYDLQAPARLLLPVITPIRNSLPRRSRAANPGTQSNWKVINASAFVDSGYSQMGWTNEGARAPQFSYSAVNASAAYQTIGAEDALTWEAESASQGFEDANGLATFLLLQQMMIKEEMALLAGNFSVTLGTPVTPTVSASGSGATLPAATYVVYVVALTVEGYAQSSVSLAGVATTKTIVGPDGKTSTINGGSSAKSAASAGQAVTLGQTLFANTTVINGAVAYAWYVGTAGNEVLQAITTINSAAFSAPLIAGTQAATSVTTDHSKNNGTLGGGTGQVTAFDGLLSQTYTAAAGGNAYVKALPTGTPGTGTKLTSTTKGSVTEIDTLLLYLWQTWRISPTKMWVNAQELNSLTTLCLNTSSAPLLQVLSDGKGLEIGANQVLRFYNNFFAMGGQPVKIPVLLHPQIPPGTIFFQCETLPSTYVTNETPNVAEVLTRRDYYRVDWPVTTRERQYGVYSEEVLAVYAPFGFAILTNIAP